MDDAFHPMDQCRGYAKKSVSESGTVVRPRHWITVRLRYWIIVRLRQWTTVRVLWMTVEGHHWTTLSIQSIGLARN